MRPGLKALPLMMARIKLLAASKDDSSSTLRLLSILDNVKNFPFCWQGEAKLGGSSPSDYYWF